MELTTSSVLISGVAGLRGGVSAINRLQGGNVVHHEAIWIDLLIIDVANSESKCNDRMSGERG